MLPRSKRVDDNLTRGYDDANDSLIRSAIQEWDDGWDESDCLFFPRLRMFALHNSGDQAIRSLADLDEHHAKRVQMMHRIAGERRWHVFFTRLQSTWYGPKVLSPDHQWDDSAPRIGFYSISGMTGDGMDVEVGHRIMEMHDTEGNVILSANCWHGEGLPIMNEYFIQEDFLSFHPQEERVKRLRRPGKPQSWYTKQTWHTNALLLLRPGDLWEFIEEFARLDRHESRLGLTKYALNASLSAGTEESDEDTHSCAKRLIKEIYKDHTENQLSSWDMTGQAKTLVLRFALNQGDVELFKKGCTVQFDGDYRPTAEVFKYVGEDLRNGNSKFSFDDIKSSLENTILSYHRLEDRYNAVRYLTVDQESKAVTMASSLQQWARSIILPSSGNYLPLLTTAGDGRALIDICFDYGDESLLHTTILPQVVAELDNDKRSDLLWIFGLLERTLDLGFTHLFRQREARDIYEEVVSRFQNRLESAWSMIDYYQATVGSSGHTNTAPKLVRLAPADLVRFFQDLTRLKLDTVLVGTLSTIHSQMSRLSHEQRDPPSYYRPKWLRDKPVKQPGAKYRNFWLPFLHELITGFEKSKTPLSKDRYGPLFQFTLEGYANVFVGKQPHHVSKDLKMEPNRVYRGKTSRVLADYLEFLRDGTRKQARFPHYKQRDKSCVKSLSEHLRVDLTYEYEKMTGGYTVVVTKLSDADKVHHEEWAKRREEFKADVLGKFDQELLRGLLGAEGYEKLVKLPFLNRERPAAAADAGAVDIQEAEVIAGEESEDQQSRAPEQANSATTVQPLQPVQPNRPVASGRRTRKTAAAELDQEAKDTGRTRSSKRVRTK